MPVAIETTAYYFLLSWDPPTFPNGVLTGYVLYMGDTLLYSGNENQFNVTGLDVSEHIMHGHLYWVYKPVQAMHAYEIKSEIF